MGGRVLVHRAGTMEPGQPPSVVQPRGAQAAPAASRGQETEAQPPCPARTVLCGRSLCQGQTPLHMDLGSTAQLPPHGSSAMDNNGYQSILTGNNR